MCLAFTWSMDNYIIAPATSCVSVKNLQNSKGCMRKCALSVSWHSYRPIRYDMTWYDMIWYMIWNDMIWYDMLWYDMIWYIC
jgi:hypothetical protein